MSDTTAGRFDSDTAEHQMTVLRDDGLYRHLRFQKPGESFYWYDIVTWPGVLVVTGDNCDFMFSRERDMLPWFESDTGRINPDYWAQKLRGDRGGSDIARRYSEDRLRSHVVQWFHEQIGMDWSPAGPPPTCDEWAADFDGFCELEPGEVIELSLELEDMLLDTGTENAAHEALRDFEFSCGFGTRPRRLTIEDSWEWDLRDFDQSFLWCCWAIVRGIERYRAGKPVEATPA